VHGEPLRFVSCSQGVQRITRHFWRTGDLGQKPAVRPAKPQLAIGLSIDLVALLVHGAMMRATEHSEIRERRRASLSPVTNVMALAEADPAAWEATAAISVM
jgi:hypothetical protein